MLQEKIGDVQNISESGEAEEENERESMEDQPANVSGNLCIKLFCMSETDTESQILYRVFTLTVFI